MRYVSRALVVAISFSVAEAAEARDYAWADRTHDCTVLNAQIEDSDGTKTSDWGDAPEAFNVRASSCLVYPVVGSMVLEGAHPRILELNFECNSKTEGVSMFQVVEVFEQPAGIAESPIETSALTDQSIEMGHSRSFKLSSDGTAHFRFPATNSVGTWKALDATCSVAD